LERKTLESLAFGVLAFAAQSSSIELRKEGAMREESLNHGAFSWMELMTTDAKSAREFYVKLFGWETEEYPMEGMDYTVIKVGGDDTGGIMTLPPEMAGTPPMWAIYVTVTDVDATARQVEELGGKILRPPSDIPNVGRFCVFSDPQGGVISAITYAGTGG
jgi:predicted enzyme related to lactoylglutathione lyase